MPIPAKAIKCQEIVTNMTGNANYPTPNPALAGISTAIGELADAYEAALDLGKTKKAIMREKDEALDNLMRTLRDYVNEVGNGDEVILMSSGFDLAKLPSPIGPLSAPINLRALYSETPGEVYLRWKPVYGASTYKIQYKSDGQDDAEWMDAGLSTKGRFTVTGLENAKYYWFRVAANGAAGLSPYSDPARGLSG